MNPPPKARFSNRDQRSRHVLLLLGSYYQENHHGIARYAREAHWTLNASYMRTGQIHLSAGKLDGIIGLITHPRDLLALRQCPRVPLVDLSAAWGTDALPDQNGLHVPRVLYDNVGIAAAAAQHFIGRGFVHIAQFNRGNYWMEQARRTVYQATIEMAGRVFHELEYFRWLAEAKRGNPARAEDKARRQLVRELRKLPKPLAVFTPADDSSLQVLQACESAHLHVPEEVAVLGCHNDLLTCEFTPVPLSSVDEDLELQGYEAARLLDQLMSHEPAPAAPIIIPVKGIVTRISTDILAVSHREVARAVRFIWGNYSRPIQTADVATAVGISRCHLMRLFQAHLGRSVADEIANKRIEHAKQLLLETDLKAWQIAEQTGFTNIVHFSNAFRRMVGKPPSHFRNQHPHDP